MKLRVITVDEHGRRDVRFLQNATEVVVCTDRGRPVSVAVEGRDNAIISTHMGEEGFEAAVANLGIKVDDFKVEVIDV
jgi:hypothetical protein